MLEPQKNLLSNKHDIATHYIVNQCFYAWLMLLAYTQHHDTLLGLFSSNLKTNGSKDYALG